MNRYPMTYYRRYSKLGVQVEPFTVPQMREGSYSYVETGERLHLQTCVAISYEDAQDLCDRWNAMTRDFYYSLSHTPIEEYKAAKMLVERFEHINGGPL